MQFRLVQVDAEDREIGGQVFAASDWKDVLVLRADPAVIREEMAALVRDIREHLPGQAIILVTKDVELLRLEPVEE